MNSDTDMKYCILFCMCGVYLWSGYEGYNIDYHGAVGTLNVDETILNVKEHLYRPGASQPNHIHFLPQKMQYDPTPSSLHIGHNDYITVSMWRRQTDSWLIVAYMVCNTSKTLFKDLWCNTTTKYPLFTNHDCLHVWSSIFYKGGY